MRKAIAVLLCVAVAGCAQLGAVVTPGTPSASTKYDALIAEIQKNTQFACSFLPTVGTVAALLKTFSGAAAPTIDIAWDIANAVCKAVAQPGAAIGVKVAAKAAPKVNGVPIRGQYVK